ncbi:MAG TPA: DUF2252 family protein [Planctomycetota bacterium]|nr:DUF2252 family protein [Planctomycetota bacterium]
MNFRAATDGYERWLGGQTRLVREDLTHKHAAMRADSFSFFRATYYRWAQQFGSLDGAVKKAPEVLAVADLHLENFGTWRDALGRLAWGINDFDEAYPLPYTNDLVRLAAGALLAMDEDEIKIGAKDACRAILEGYREGLSVGGKPFVIGDHHRWFKPILQDPPGDPGKFWDKLQLLPRELDKVPKEAVQAIESLLPEARLKYVLRHRTAGLGNLGKMRYTAIAEWQGGPIAREAKALTLSAAAWARLATGAGAASGAGVRRVELPRYAEILAGAIRSHDPFLKVAGAWIVRRLAPDCRRLDISALTRAEDQEWLLNAMGFETANVHLGTRDARRAIQKHLKDQPKNWLRKSAEAMQAMVMNDFEAVEEKD